MPTGLNNDITDVPAVSVGHVSIIRGEGALLPGHGPVRTGVTAILPHQGNLYRRACPAGIEVFNGYGKSVGIPYILETGILNGPILLTNTLSVYDVANGVTTFMLTENPEIGNDARTPNPVVFECDDSYLNDLRGRHVKPWDAILAIQRAGPGPIGQGNVGAGVGMSCFELKGGIGSSSRLVTLDDQRVFLLGVIALANFGILRDLQIGGIPVGMVLAERRTGIRQTGGPRPGRGSLIMVAITDAPLTGGQLAKLAKRSALGQARTGSISMTGSGDFCLAVSNNRHGQGSIADRQLDFFFRAMVEACAESIWNALFYAETMEGRDGRWRQALPIQETVEIIRSFYPW